MGVVVGEVLGLSDVECTCSLGSVTLSVGVAIGAVMGTFDGVSILRDGVGGFGSFSALLSVSATFFRVLRAGYPASKLGVVVEGGVIRMVLISIVACLKKSYKSTFVIGISLRKKG